MKRETSAITPGQARKLLGLTSEADTEAVSRAFRAAVKSAHPDRGGDAEQLRKIIEAHRLLKSLPAGTLAFAPVRSEAPPAPRAIPLQISVREALFGGQRRLDLEGGRCIDVRLPAGLRAGDAVRLARAGGDGADLLLRISIAVEDGLSVHGHDLWMEVAAPSDQLETGAGLEIDTPRGRRSVTAPAAIAEGGKVRLKGEGLPARDRHPAGDLILRLRLEPESEEPASRRLLRRFSARWAA